MSQRNQLERILEIDRQIRAGLYPNARTLAKRFETGTRVIYTDREFMVNRMCAPIMFDKDRGGWYYADPTYVLPSVMVTEGEMLAFFLSVEIARRSLGTGLEQDLRSAVAKITRGLKGPVTVDLETLRQHYTFAQPGVHGVDEKLLLDLHRAIREKRRVRIKYFTASRNAHTEREVDPYHLYNVHGDWFLVAFDHMRSKFRNFQAGRIENWQIQDKVFIPDSEFKITEYMKQAFQTERGDEPVEITVRFDAYQARYIRERHWHETQQVEELLDGGLVLRFQSGGLNEVQRWVMQYGNHAEVIGPEELRQRVAKEVRKMAECYGELLNDERTRNG